MNTHLWGWLKICMTLCYNPNCFCIHVESQMVFLCLPEYSKRVYQGVRVKHTVKDLLAEKRSRQTNGPRYNVSTSCRAFVLSCLPLLHFSPNPNTVATADILVTQLRHWVEKVPSACLHFVLFCALGIQWLIH